VETAQICRLLQGAGSACGFIGATYLAMRGFPPRYLATAIGFTQCFGMLGGAAGQFAVGRLIHGVIRWQQFWWMSGLGIFVIAILVLIATPKDPDGTRASQGSWLAMFAPYKEVLANPQSYL
jgi:MFS family permease